MPFEFRLESTDFLIDHRPQLFPLKWLYFIVRFRRDAASTTVHHRLDLDASASGLTTAAFAEPQAVSGVLRVGFPQPPRQDIKIVSSSAGVAMGGIFEAGRGCGRRPLIIKEFCNILWQKWLWQKYRRCPVLLDGLDNGMYGKNISNGMLIVDCSFIDQTSEQASDPSEPANFVSSGQPGIAE